MKEGSRTPWALLTVASRRQGSTSGSSAESLVLRDAHSTAMEACAASSHKDKDKGLG